MLASQIPAGPYSVTPYKIHWFRKKGKGDVPPEGSGTGTREINWKRRLPCDIFIEHFLGEAEVEEVNLFRKSALGYPGGCFLFLPGKMLDAGFS